MQRTLLSSVLLAALSLGLVAQSVAQEAATSKSAKALPVIPAPPTTEERVERLERLINSQGLVDILLRLENLQKDVQNIQGDNEVQMHKLDELRKRQRELYIDIDRRLLQLERKQTAQAPVAVNTPPPLPATRSRAADTSVSGKDKAVSKSPATTSTVAGGKPTSGTRTAVTAKALVSEVEQETEQQAYQKAFNLLRELRYDKAGLAFRNFIETYPDGRYAHIAQYWLAEASYAQRDFKTAIADYQKLIDNYPGSPKRAEAMLKIGYSYYELKDYSKAQAMLEQLLASYPSTTEAGQAQNLLQKIKINNAS
ncbi:MAG TPA: tol-pal system protein YbgF [Gammaproteobacteria bacterium]|nr:tol-pal system protein YbgF [Gammaproteobacteria bacterium]